MCNPKIRSRRVKKGLLILSVVLLCGSGLQAMEDENLLKFIPNTLIDNLPGVFGGFSTVLIETSHPKETFSARKKRFFSEIKKSLLSESKTDQKPNLPEFIYVNLVKSIHRSISLFEKKEAWCENYECKHPEQVLEYLKTLLSILGSMIKDEVKEFKQSVVKKKCSEEGITKFKSFCNSNKEKSPNEDNLFFKYVLETKGFNLFPLLETFLILFLIKATVVLKDSTDCYYEDGYKSIVKSLFQTYLTIASSDIFCETLQITTADPSKMSDESLKKLKDKLLKSKIVIKLMKITDEFFESLPAPNRDEFIEILKEQS